MDILDVDLAIATAQQAPAGKRVRAAQAHAEATGLRAASAATLDEVWRITQLSQPADVAQAQVLVLDRADWAASTLDGFGHMLEPGLNRAAQEFPEDYAKLTSPVARSTAAVQLGGVLGYLSTRVLGQFDPFAGGPGGRLVLVAPNTLKVHRELGVDATDFRMWVCLHEQTHRVQFAAAPWLRDYILGMVTDMLDLVLTPGTDLRPQALKQRLSRATGVMSLLEGHANLVMDSADPSLIPSQPEIRRRFAQRKPQGGPFGALFRKLIGMDMKMAQYKDGQKFCDAVVESVGMAGLNRVFEGPEMLPTEYEVHHPQTWILRTQG